MLAMLMGLKSISPQALQQRLQEEGLTVIDVNARQSWLCARVPGARNLTVDFDAATLPADKGGALVFYCSNPLCLKAPQAARRAKQLGYQDILVMSAGIKGWTEARLPVDAGA